MSTWSVASPWHMAGALRYVLAAPSGEDWHVDVALPGPMVADVAGPGPYPTLYVMDGSATFSITAQTVENTVANCQGLFPAMAVVGISPVTDSWRRINEQRFRDLSPSVVDEPRFMTEYGLGGADDMLDLMEHTVIPFLEDRHPLDPRDRGVAGWSLGGLFSWYAVLSRRSVFRRCLAVSPSLLWDQKRYIDATLVTEAELAGAEVYLAVGECEGDPDRTWPAPPGGFSPAAAEWIRGWDSTNNLCQLARLLSDRGDVRVHADVIPDEQHATIWNVAVMRGLKYLYGAA